MLYCRACGYRLPEEADSCPLCGGRLTRLRGERTASLHTHTEAGERCVLPNRERPRTQRPKPARAALGPGRIVLLVLGILCTAAALMELILLPESAQHLPNALSSAVLASLFLQLSRLPRGSRFVQGLFGRRMSVGQFVVARVLLALVLRLFVAGLIR